MFDYVFITSEFQWLSISSLLVTILVFFIVHFQLMRSDWEVGKGVLSQKAYALFHLSSYYRDRSYLNLCWIVQTCFSFVCCICAISMYEAHPEQFSQPLWQYVVINLAPIAFVWIIYVPVRITFVDKFSVQINKINTNIDIFNDYHITTNRMHELMLRTRIKRYLLKRIIKKSTQVPIPPKTLSWIYIMFQSYIWFAKIDNYGWYTVYAPIKHVRFTNGEEQLSAAQMLGKVGAYFDSYEIEFKLTRNSKHSKVGEYIKNYHEDNNWI